VVVGGALLLAGAVSAQIHRYPTSRDAFLHQQADTADELVGLLQANPTARKRLAKHFKKSESELLAYMKDNLELRSLERDVVVNNHGVTRTGRIYAIKSRLKKGTRVWVDKTTGTGVLKWICTNPITVKLPKVQPEKVVRRIETPVKVPKQVAIEEMAVTPTEDPEPMPEPVTPQIAMIEEPILVPETPAPATGRAALTSPTSTTSNWGVPLIALAAVRTSSITPAGRIPEPGTLALVGAGLGALIAATRRRR
jgi:hypothetical protein